MDMPKLQMKYFFNFIILTFFIACKSETASTTKHYFDIKGFVASQIAFLKLQNPMVEKKLLVGGESVVANQTESKTQKISDWGKELELFSQTDLNKQAYISSYETIRADSLSYEYRLKSGEKRPVQQLKIKLNDNNQIETLEADVLVENQLYNSKKHLFLNCGKVKNGDWGITRYEISGFQHLYVSEPKRFEVKGRVVW
jgi:hypothetical protein